jgi:hypothetical protein
MRRKPTKAAIATARRASQTPSLAKRASPPMDNRPLRKGIPHLKKNRWTLRGCERTGKETRVLYQRKRISPPPTATNPIMIMS